MMQDSFDSSDDDPSAEGMAIAIAYREANEMDTMAALNEQSNCRKDKPPGLKYYLVPADWMRLVWRVVLQHTPKAATAMAPGKNHSILFHTKNSSIGTNNNTIRNSSSSSGTTTMDNQVALDWRDQVGAIPTQDLLEPPAVAAAVDTGTTTVVIRKGTYAQALASATTKSTTTATTSSPSVKGAATTAASNNNNNNTLRSGLQHEMDYYLLGSNTWLLLHGKFGTLGPTLVRKVCFHPTQDSSIAVVVVSSTSITSNGSDMNNNKGMLIPIPGTGRFPYEASFQQHAAAATRSTAATGNKQQFHPPQHPVAAVVAAAAAAKHQHVVGNVSDDETDDAVQQYPAMVDNDDLMDRMSTSDHPETTTATSTSSATNHSSLSSPPPILLLPPSTTTFNNNNHESNNIHDYWNDSNHSNSSNNINHDDIELGLSSSDKVNIIGQNNGRTTSSYFNDIEADDPADSSSVVMGTGNNDRLAITAAPKYTHTSILRYGSGLGNLGNTCFMNSTLQCLSHTHSLQSYFLSGDYQRDLNRDNPLGTGGELATSFAQLLAEMWWEKTTINHNALGSHTRSWSHSTSHVVYPRSFKFTVGKHAEQFMGYDQHDSQEFATYLLDALHEDTNRVLTAKPYIEKPEQAEGETDESAADKAWELHLKREDSRVMDNFMGQVKSRVQCCEEGCGRVSTTFDPFMFLSVPIPGSSERTIKVTYVPLDPNMRAQALSVTLAKAATIADLIKQMCSTLVKYAIVQSEADLPALEDLVAVDMWSNDIYTLYKHSDDVDKIKDNDDTWVYALQPLQDLRKLATKDEKDAATDTDNNTSVTKIGAGFDKRYTVDVATITSLNRNGQWATLFGKYLKNELYFHNAFNKTKGKHEDRIKIYQRLTNFIDLCHKELVEDGVGQKRAHEETSSSPPTMATAATHILTMPSDPNVPGLGDRCDANPMFQNVNTRHDVAILEFFAGKMRAEILQMECDEKNQFPDGVVIVVRSRRQAAFCNRETIISKPLVLRVASDMTVYGLRQELARRFARSLKKGRNGHSINNNHSFSGPSSSSGGQATSEETSESIPMEDDSNNHIPTGGDTAETPPSSMNGFHHDPDNTFGSPELVIFRQIPLSSDRGKNIRSSYSSPTLGSLHKPNGSQHGGMIDDDNRGGRRPTSIASPTDEYESENICQTVGDQGIVNLEWPDDLIDSSFDTEEFDACDNVNRIDPNDASRGEKCITVQDCIAKYCQKEQLEETEMWYCNQCKKHVRAWKQFHLFRTPPVLIVHLKRFHFSASTHRRDKIGRFIDFPLEGLDLTEHVLHYTEEEKPIYDCYAVSNHYGGLGGGHYTAHCLNDDGVWCYYDDSRITANVDPKEAISDAAYVLYYRRRDAVADANQDFLLNIQTPPPEDEDQQAQGVGPAIIMDTSVVRERTMGEPSDMSSTNAAVIGEDDNTMEVDVGSRSTSPMGSMDGVDDFASFRPQEHDYGGDDDTEDLPDALDRLPRQ